MPQILVSWELLLHDLRLRQDGLSKCLRLGGTTWAASSEGNDQVIQPLIACRAALVVLMVARQSLWIKPASLQSCSGYLTRMPENR